MSDEPLMLRVRPHDREAEQSVLGALMLDPNAVATVRDGLEPADFYEERHAHIYAAALELSDRGEPIDPITLRAQLERAGTLSRSGGIDYIAELSIVTPTAASVKNYADIVVEHGLRRQLIDAGARVNAMGFDETMCVEDALGAAEAAILDIRTKRRIGSETTPAGVVFKEIYAEIERAMNEKGFVPGLKTGFRYLDAALNGLKPGQLVMLAARPGLGKTSMAMNIAYNVASAGQHVVVYSLEMTKQELVYRMTATRARIDMWRLQGGNITVDEASRLAIAGDQIHRLPLSINDSAFNLDKLWADARGHRARGELDLLILDYLQLLQVDRRKNRVEAVSELSAGLKAMAKDLRVPIIALSQLSRESERRENKRPVLSDLRDSGSLEQDSDVVLFLYRDPACRESIVTLIVAKNRNGPVHDIVLRWNPELTLFGEV